MRIFATAVSDDFDQTIVIVDDDANVREAADNLLRSAGFCTHCFASAEEFLSSPHLRVAACLVLDICLPGMTGLQLRERLLRLDVQIPIVFVTASEDAVRHICGQAVQACAQSVLLKPFNSLELLNAIRAAIGR